MAHTLPSTETPPPQTEKADLPDETILEDKTPEWLKAPRVLPLFTAVLGPVYLFFNYRPLWHTDLWGHLAYGRLIWNQGRLPATEPLMALSSGVPFVDMAWLSQLIGYGAIAGLGVSSVKFLYAVSVVLTLALLVWRFYQRSGRILWPLLGCAWFLGTAWQQLLIVRPQLAGMVCYTVLLVLLTSRRPSRAEWIAVPALFALWGNLHGSFPVGLGLLGAFCLGRAVDVTRRSGRLRAVLRDDGFRRYLLLAELAVVGTLVNPYGLGIYAEVVRVATHPNLSSLIEWQALHLKMQQGQAAALAGLILIVFYRLSPRRVSASEVLLLVGLGGAALWTSRMILWWAPAAAWFFVLHGNAIWPAKTTGESTVSARSGKWSVVTAGLIWILFTVTPFGNRVLSGEPQKLEDVVSEATPVDAAEYLQDNPPQGQVFNDYEWGDYLLWAGPSDMQVFVASHAHLIPRQVWQHYFLIVGTEAGWEEALGRYGVNTVVVDPSRRSSLVGRLRSDAAWRLGYEDERAVVFHRRDPI